MNDPYVYPGTAVLINKLNLRDGDLLAEYERRLTAQRLREPPPQTAISYEGYKTLHHHIFQDLYDWAGQSRTVSLAKGETFFGPARFVDREMEKCFQRLNAENNLQGLNRVQFAERAAEHLCEINAIHPFREGNGRSQRLFLKTLAQQAGHKIKIENLKRDSWNQASIAGFKGDYRLMTRVIADILPEHSHDQT